jgi:hypothetical protein
MIRPRGSVGQWINNVLNEFAAFVNPNNDPLGGGHWAAGTTPHVAHECRAWTWYVHGKTRPVVGSF